MFGRRNKMEHFIYLDKVVTGFDFSEQSVDFICGKEILKIEKNSGEIVFRKEIFDKEGYSRNLIADEKHIFIFDFCTLYILCRDNYEFVGKWQLGTDLRTDIVDIVVDENTVYCSIRNGKIIKIDRDSFNLNEFHVYDSSMWRIKIYDKYLVCGTVDGKLLLVDKITLLIEKTLILSKKNINRIYVDGEILYAASQDGKLFRINLRNFEIERSRTNTHKKMFDCAGIYKSALITVSFPCSEICFWDKETLEKQKTINVPLRLSGRVYIENNFLYIASRNILGIDRIALGQSV